MHKQNQTGKRLQRALPCPESQPTAHGQRDAHVGTAKWSWLLSNKTAVVVMMPVDYVYTLHMGRNVGGRGGGGSIRDGSIGRITLPCTVL